MLTVFRFSQIVGVPVKDITGKRRHDHIVIARQLYWKLLREYHGVTFQHAGAMCGRTPSTIISGIKRVNGLLESGDKMALEMWGKVMETDRYSKRDNCS